MRELGRIGSLLEQVGRRMWLRAEGRAPGPSPFGVVFCYGTLYHLSNPVCALSRLVEVCGGEILLETLPDPQDRITC